MSTETHQAGQSHVNHLTHRSSSVVSRVGALVLLTVLLVVSLLRMQVPSPQAADIAEGKFSAYRTARILQTLSTDSMPHPVGSALQAQVHERIVQNLALLGYGVETQATMSCGEYNICAAIKNVLVRLPGQEAGSSVLLVAHYDSVGVGAGIADDGASVAAILEIARILKSQAPFRNSIILLFTDGEELGMLGAKAFAAEHPWAREVKAVVNLEARGTSGLSLMFETSENNAELVAAYANSVPRPAASSLFAEIYRTLPNDTDLTILKRYGFAGLNLAFIAQSTYYHTPWDNLEHLDLGSLQHQGDTALAIVKQLAEMDLSDSSDGNAVYTDLLGIALLWWPESWSIPLALLFDALLFLVMASLIRRGELSVRNILWGSGACLMSILLPLLLTSILMWGISQVSSAGQLGKAYPWPVFLSLWATILFCGLGTLGLFSNRACWGGWSMGAWLCWGAFATLSAMVMPAVNVYFLVPLGLAALLLAIVHFSPLHIYTAAYEFAYVSAALSAGLLLIPLALQLGTALGFENSLLIISPLVLVMSILLPLFTHMGRLPRLQRLILLTSAGVMLASAILASLMPAYSETQPQLLNIMYFEDKDTDTAYWIAKSPDNSIPANLRQVMPFEAVATCVFPWLSSACFVSPAKPMAIAAPELTSLSEETVGDERIIKARLWSPRGADRVLLLVPKGSPVNSVYLEGESLPLEENEERFWFFEGAGVSREGLTLEIHLTGQEPVEVTLVDQSPGLPATGQQLIYARPTIAIPYQSGDVTIILRSLKL